MDKDKLAVLRERYGGDSAPAFVNPEFQKVADILYPGTVRRKPYAGITSLLDAPLCPNAVADNQLDQFDIGLVGVAMDLGVTNRPGSRYGPRAIRQIERVGPYHHVFRCVPSSLVRVADFGDVPLSSRFDLAKSHAEIEAYFTQIVAGGVVPISVGGDHSISLPILKALGRERPVGMIHIDAHCDTGAPFEDSRFHHGGPFREAVLAGVLDGERVIQIGIRGNAEYLWEFSYDSGMTVIHAEEFSRLGVDAVIARMREVVGDGPVYLSFDVDSLDPAFAPGTGTPEQGGLSTREAMALIRGAAGLQVIGGDVVEVAPAYDSTTNTAQAGAQMLFEIFTVAALAACAANA